MRKQFVEGGEVEANYETDRSDGTFIDADGYSESGLPGIVRHDTPWATVAVEVDGGYMVFESLADYEIWRNQK